MTIKNLFRKAKNFVYRDAITGRFVKAAFALLNPKTTVKEKKK